MTTPLTGNPISMGDVNTETNWTQSMYNFFQFSTVGGLGALMYHNLSMGLGAQSAKEAVYDPFSLGASGTNLNLGAWYNYNQTPNLITTFDITNNNVDYIVTVDLKIFDPASSTRTAFYLASVSNGAPVNEVNFDTGFGITTASLANGTYEIHCDVSAQYIGPPLPPPPPPPVGPGVLNNVTDASDSDGVGAGIVRVENNIPNFDEFNPVFNFPIVQGNISGNGIYANKRTTFSLTFN